LALRVFGFLAELASCFVTQCHLCRAVGVAFTTITAEDCHVFFKCRLRYVIYGNYPGAAQPVETITDGEKQATGTRGRCDENIFSGDNLFVLASS